MTKTYKVSVVTEELIKFRKFVSKQPMMLGKINVHVVLIMSVDVSSLFVKFEFFKVSFDKYLLGFTSKSFVNKKSLKNLFCLMYASKRNLIYLMCGGKK